jgi:hypothetical protein
MDTNNLTMDKHEVISRRHKWKWFWIGLAVRLIGVLFLWLGDGHDSVFHKALVIIGLILSIGGITVLRHLLFLGLRRRK